MKKAPELYSINKIKYPIFHEGDFFEITYYAFFGLSVAVLVTIWASISFFIPDTGWSTTLIAILVGLFVAALFLFELSKIVSANFYFTFEQFSAIKETLNEG